MGVQIKASFKKDTLLYNGLSAIEQNLIDKPLQEHYVICKVRTSKTQIDHTDGGSVTPQVEFFHIEVMLSDKDEKSAKVLFERSARARLGVEPQPTLPFDGENDDAADGGGDGEQAGQ